jgi:hypothetical protein
MVRFLGEAVFGLALASTALILGCVWSPSLNGGMPTFFKFHPTFMAVGACLLLTLGLVAYVSSFGEAVNSRFPDRASRRLLHGTLGLLAACCLLVGYLTAFTAHEARGASHRAAGSPLAHQAHVWAGYATLALVAAQAVVGMHKYVLKTRDNLRFAAWHAKAGPALWALGLVCVMLGAWAVFGPGAVGAAVAIILVVAALLVAGLAQALTAARLGGDDHKLDGGEYVTPSIGSLNTSRSHLLS